MMIVMKSTATEDEIRDYCRGKIAHYKIPRYVKFVDGFPMTVTGKIQKFVMREASVKELGLEQAASVTARPSSAAPATGERVVDTRPSIR